MITMKIHKTDNLSKIGIFINFHDYNKIHKTDNLSKIGIFKNFIVTIKIHKTDNLRLESSTLGLEGGSNM